VYSCRSRNNDWSVERELLWGTRNNVEPINNGNNNGNNENILNRSIELENNGNSNNNGNSGVNPRYSNVQDNQVLRNIGGGIQIGNAGIN